MATIKEIATRAGVSIGTVDRVLHNRGRVAPETADRIHQIVKELDYKPNSVGQGLALRKKKITLSFFCPDPTRFTFFENVLAGAKQKAAELAQYGVEVQFCMCNYTRSAVDLTTFETDGIAVPGTWESPQIREILERAKEREIPVVSYNLPLGDGESLAYVGCDYVQAGKIAAGLCALVTNGHGKIGVLSEDNGQVFSFSQRFKGFQKVLTERYPEMKIEGVYFPEKGMEEAVHRMLGEHPMLDVVYLVNPGDYQACRMIREVEDRPALKIITNDLTRQVRQMVQEGLVSAVICQEPERQGAQPLELLFQYLAHGEISEQKEHFTALSIHIAQNI